eukprot:jgi/Tetstr1/441481/TSEL_003124.t1
MELPVGKNLSAKVKAMVAVWRLGSERKAAMNDSQWSAKNQQRDPTVVLKKGEAGFKEWSDLRNWLQLTGRVDVEWEEEGDPHRAPDEDAIAYAAELQNLESDVKYVLKRPTASEEAERCWREAVNKQKEVEKELRSQLVAEERARVEADILRYGSSKIRLMERPACLSYKLREATTRATVRKVIGRKAEQLEAWLTHAVGDDDSSQFVYAEGRPGAQFGAPYFRRSKWDADMEKLVQMVLPYGNLMIKWPSVEDMLKGQGEELAAVGLSTTEGIISSTLDLKLVLQHRARLLLKKEGLIKFGESLSIQLVADATGIFNATRTSATIVVLKIVWALGMWLR